MVDMEKFSLELVEILEDCEGMKSEEKAFEVKARLENWLRMSSCKEYVLDPVRCVECPVVDSYVPIYVCETCEYSREVGSQVRCEPQEMVASQNILRTLIKYSGLIELADSLSLRDGEKRFIQAFLE
jgi:hypothetical protein